MVVKGYWLVVCGLLDYVTRGNVTKAKESKSLVISRSLESYPKSIFATFPKNLV